MFKHIWIHIKNVMDNITLEIAKDVFSVLPNKSAEKASLHFWQRFSSFKQTQASAAAWVDFTNDGRFLRCGITDLFDASTRILSEETENNAIRSLLDWANDNRLLHGKLAISDDYQSLFWVVPQWKQSSITLPNQQIKIIQINEHVFKEIIKIANQETKLTNAELRVMFQLTGGLTLKESATLDGVSTHTKREQSKIIFAKLECSGQVDLIRLIMGQLIELIYVCNAETDHTNVAETFARRYYQNEADLIVKRLPNERTIRYFEYGPQNGKPVLVMHGMLFPIVIPNSKEFVIQHNLKLIIPLRLGYLEDQSTSQLLSHSDLTEQSMQDIAEFVSNTFNVPLPVIGLMHGTAIALKFASHFPKLTSKLILVSPNLQVSPKLGAPVQARFTNGLKSISAKSGLLRQVGFQFSKYLIGEKEMKQFLHKAYGKSHSDMSIMEIPVGGQPSYVWVADAFQKSILGVADDFQAAINYDADELRQLELPLLIVHGTESPVAKTSDIQKLAKKSKNSELVLIDNAGHFAIIAHSKKVWQLIADYFS